MSIFTIQRMLEKSSNKLQRRSSAYQKDDYPDDYGGVPVYAQKRRGTLEPIHRQLHYHAIPLLLPTDPEFNEWITTSTAREQITQNGPFYNRCRFKGKEYPEFYPELQPFYERLKYEQYLTTNIIKNETDKSPIFKSSKFIK